MPLPTKKLAFGFDSDFGGGEGQGEEEFLSSPAARLHFILTVSFLNFTR